MRGVSSGALRLAVAFLLVGSVVGAATLAVAADGTSGAQNAEYSLSELRQGGQQVSGAAPSTRWLDGNRIFIDREHTNPLKDSGGESWQVEKLLRPGDTVNTNKLRFHYTAGPDTSNETYTLHVVYWQLGEREVAENGTTVTRAAAVNQTHETHKLAFSGPSSTAEVDLRPHYEESVRVTMWIESAGSTARWSEFRHKSLATAKQITTQTAGERMWWLVTTYVVWIVVFGLAGVAAALWMIRRAGAGPQLGIGTWAFLIAIAGFLALLINYEGIATLFVEGPKILAFVTVALLMIPWVEGQDDRLRKFLFVRPVVTEAVSASGAEAKDALYLELSEKNVAELPDGTLSVVKPGPIKFLARVLGGAAPLQGAREMGRTEVRAEGKTRHDRVVWIKPSADEIMDYAPETIGITRPPDLALSIGASGLVLLVVNSARIGAGALSWLSYAMMGFCALTSFEVRSGYGKVDPATAHQRSAHVTTMVAGKEMDDAETLDEARRETYKERSKSSKDVEEVIEVRDETLISEMLGADVSAGVRQSDDDGPAFDAAADVATEDDEPRDREVPADD